MAGSVRRKWIALLGSFGVYLVPLVGPPAAWSRILKTNPSLNGDAETA